MEDSLNQGESPGAANIPICGGQVLHYQQTYFTVLSTFIPLRDART